MTTRENAYLTDKQISEIKDLLLADKEDILNKQSDNTTYLLDRNELTDPVDEATMNSQTEKDLKIRSRQNYKLKKITYSLDKIENGTYGLCEECDAEIPFGRLKARKVADLCIACAEEKEKEESSRIKVSKSRGKTIHEMGNR